MSTKHLRLRLLILILIIALLPLINLLSDISTDQKKLFFTSFALAIFVLIACVAMSAKLSALYIEIEGRARRNEVRIQIFMESVHEGIFTADEGGKLREINRYLAELLNYGPDFLIGKNIWNYIKSDRGIPCEKWFYNERNVPISHFSLPMTGKMKNGQEIPLKADLHIIREKDTFCGFRGFVQSTKEKFVLEKIKNDILFSLYRNVRGDLEAFKLFSLSLPEDFRKSVLRFREEIISQINPEYFSEALTAGMKREFINFISILKELKNWAEPLAGIKEQNVIFDFPENEEVRYICDADKIYQALKNILLNALEFSGQNGVIRVMAVFTDENIEITISDNGAGIPLQDKDSIFEPFFTSEHIQKEKAPRMGLGLWLAKEFIKLHHGYIRVESELGKGSFFVIHIPRKTAPEMSEHVKWHEKRFIT